MEKNANRAPNALTTTSAASLTNIPYLSHNMQLENTHYGGYASIMLLEIGCSRGIKGNVSNTLDLYDGSCLHSKAISLPKLKANYYALAMKKAKVETVATQLGQFIVAYEPRWRSWSQSINQLINQPVGRPLILYSSLLIISKV